MPAAERTWTDERGKKWREFSTDFRHLPEHDRPPRLICETLAAQLSIHHDTSPDRPPIPIDLPGKDIRELKGKHSGRVAILFNGPSLALHDLSKITCPIIGLNRTHVGHPTYHGPQPDYLCAVDNVWMGKPEVQNHPGLINGSRHPGNYGYRVRPSMRMFPFSFDLWRDGFAPPVPGTTGVLALQVAVWMGFKEIYCLGLDLGGNHFDGTPSSQAITMSDRFFLLGAPMLIAAGVKVRVCGSPASLCTAFPPCPFEDLLASESEAA